MKRLLLALVIAAPGCRLPAADHERLGDDAYREGRFTVALTEYQAAHRRASRSRLLAKTGAAALGAGDFAAAIEAYRELAADDPSRVAEAAVGLARAIDGAHRAGAGDLTARGVLALRTVSPERPLGRFAEFSVGTADAEAAALVGLLPTAMATARTPSTVDSLLVRYADALRTTTACEGAALGYETVLRRTRRPRLRAAASEGLASCGLVLGLDALSTERAQAAERWFDAVLAVESASERAWRALIGRGDALLLQGDALGASVAYQGVLGAPGVPDTLRELAAGRLNALASASPSQPPGA